MSVCRIRRVLYSQNVWTDFNDIWDVGIFSKRLLLPRDFFETCSIIQNIGVAAIRRKHKIVII